MKFSISKVCLAASWFFILSGGMMLCACPGWTAIGIGFAALSFIGRKAAFVWPSITLVAAIFFTGVQWTLEGKEDALNHRVKAAAARAAQERASLAVDSTNNPPPATNR